MSFLDERLWYVLKTRPRAEKQVETLLTLRGAESYLPLIRSHRNRQRTEPLFPGYLFCHVEIPSVQWVEVRSLPGVAYALSTEGRPVPVSSDLVETMRLRVQYEEECHQRSRFKPGEQVRILGGPFQGLEAAFDRRLSASGRSRVLLHLVNRLVPVELQEGLLVSSGSRNFG